MNGYDAAGRSLLQRMVDYRNRAEALRMAAERGRDKHALFMLSVAAGYDREAATVHAILAESAAASS